MQPSLYHNEPPRAPLPQQPAPGMPLQGRPQPPSAPLLQPPPTITAAQVPHSYSAYHESATNDPLNYHDVMSEYAVPLDGQNVLAPQALAQRAFQSAVAPRYTNLIHNPSGASGLHPKTTLAKLYYSIT